MANRYFAYVRFEVLEFEADSVSDADAIVNDLIEKLGDCPNVGRDVWDNVSWDVLEHPDNEYDDEGED
jgi:hypothetical protein